MPQKFRKTMRFKQAACAIDVNVGLAAVAAMLCVAAPQAGSRGLKRIGRGFGAVRDGGRAKPVARKS